MIAVAGCSGAGSATRAGTPNGFVPGVRGAVVTPQRRHRKRVRAYAHIIIPRKYHRRSSFISAATRGIQIVANSGGFIETTVAALGPKAPDCTSTSYGFVCFVTATVWEGTNKIDVTTYDTAPVSGAIPSGAKILGLASVSADVTPGSSAPSLAIFLGGEIGSINGGPAYSTVAADGSTHDAAIVLDPKDFGNQPITAGKNDPYANPIHATLTEVGGSGHATLAVSGSAKGAKAIVKFSSDTLAVRYDGGGKAGYTMKVKLTAAGAPTETLQISPLIVEGNGVYLHALGLNGTSSTPTLTITEANAPSSQTYSLTPSGCSGIAAFSAVSGSGSSATFSVNGGASPSATGCSVTVTDGLYSTALLLPVTNTPLSGSVNVNGIQVKEYTLTATPGPLTVGSDNNIWLLYGGSGASGESAPQIVSLHPTATGPTVGTPVSVGPVSLMGITTGADGALWMADSNENIDRVTPSGIINIYVSTFFLPCPQSPIPANDGTLWIADSCNGIGNVSMAGGSIRVPAFSATYSAYHIAQGADGDLYFDDSTASTNIFRWDMVSANPTPIAIPGATAGVTAVSDMISVPNDGATGAIWFTTTTPSTTTTGAVYRLPIGSTTATLMASTGSALTSGNVNAIAAGADNAVWYTDGINNKLYRLSLKSGATPIGMTLPTAAATPSWIVLGPDGTLYVDEPGVSKVARVFP